MALSLKFSINLSSDGVTLTVTDKTSAYSGINQGGYGTPNPATTDATSATFKIAKRNSDGTFATEVSTSVYSTLPSSSGGEIEIEAEDGIDEDTYTDGIYRMIYTVAGSSGGTPFSSSVTQYKVLRNSIANCYQEKSVAVSDCNCACADIESSFKCFSLYMRLLRGTEQCGNLNEIQSYLDKLTEMCDDENCNC